MATQAQTWASRGDYVENCNCDVVCPCLFSTKAPLTSQPTEGACEVPFVFHIDQGHFGDTRLDGLNTVVVLRTPGAMAEGNASAALYIDERADEPQQQALTKIFSGAAGGPMGALAPLISTILGVKQVPITYTIDGNRRSVEVPGIMQLAVRAAPSVVPNQEIWASNAHPLFPEKLAMAYGDQGSVYEDYGMRWDNSGKNGHYAPMSWSNG